MFNPAEAQRLRRDMIAVNKYVKEVSTGEGKEILEPKDNVGTETNGYKLARNKFKLEIKRVPTIRGVSLWNRLSVALAEQLQNKIVVRA